MTCLLEFLVLILGKMGAQLKRTEYKNVEPKVTGLFKKSLFQNSCKTLKPPIKKAY